MQLHTSCTVDTCKMTCTCICFYMLEPDVPVKYESHALRCQTRRKADLHRISKSHCSHMLCVAEYAFVLLSEQVVQCFKQYGFQRQRWWNVLNAAHNCNLTLLRMF